MTVIPGSELINSSLYVIAQSLLFPVIIILLAIMVYVIIEAGGIISEYSIRKKINPEDVESFIKTINEHATTDEINLAINGSSISDNHKIILEKIAETNNLGEKSDESLARSLIDSEESRMIKSLQNTDIVAKIGPAIGLIGTLIPMGPGLSALGEGNIQVLANNLMIAFDAAIIGLAAAAIGFTISKIRRRWYEDDILILETLADSVLEVKQDVKTKTETAAIIY
jgi:biopolymer transport protein ExbB/TolQ